MLYEKFEKYRLVYNQLDESRKRELDDLALQVVNNHIFFELTDEFNSFKEQLEQKYCEDENDDIMCYYFVDAYLTKMLMSVEQPILLLANGIGVWARQDTKNSIYRERCFGREAIVMTDCVIQASIHNFHDVQKGLFVCPDNLFFNYYNSITPLTNHKW